MVNYAVPLWMIISSFSFILFLLIATIWFMFMVIKFYTNDIMIIFDKDERWKILYRKLRFKDREKVGAKTYKLEPSAAKLNRRGKALYHFSDNNPLPADINIKYKKAEWLTAQTLDTYINNKVAQQIIEPEDKFKDTIILLGAICAMVGAAGSIVVLLIVTGVLGSVGL